MNNGWTATARKIDMDDHDLPIERVLNYQFKNKNGLVFRVRLLDDGQLEINCNGQVVVYPRASNEIVLDQHQF